MYNALVSITFAKLCGHHHYEFTKPFHHPNRNSVLILSSKSPFFLHPATDNFCSTFCLYHLSVLDISCRWNLRHFPFYVQYISLVLKVHLSCSMYQHFNLFMDELCSILYHILFIWWCLGCFNLWANVNNCTVCTSICLNSFSIIWGYIPSYLGV